MPLTYTKNTCARLGMVGLQACPQMGHLQSDHERSAGNLKYCPWPFSNTRRSGVL